jgi:hypothetical protein
MVMMAIVLGFVLGFFVVCLPTAQSGVRVGVVVALIIENAARRDRGSSMLFSARLVLGESRSSEKCRSNKNGTEGGEDKKRFHGHSELSPFSIKWRHPA